MKAVRIGIITLIHLVGLLFVVLGFAGYMEGYRWAPIDEDGVIVGHIEPLIPGAFISWGLAVIILFWVYHRTTNQPEDESSN